MKLSILTTITNPIERQDKFLEALANYCELADEVVVVNGGKPISIHSFDRIKIVDLEWPYEWNWVEYPRHLNEGLKYCTGDWVLRLDIDQFVHEKDFEELKRKLAFAPEDCQAVSMQKMSYTYAQKYYQKGATEIIIRRLPTVSFGKLIRQDTDLCFPILQTGVEVIYTTQSIIDNKIFYELPIGRPLKAYKSGISYHNYDYYFRDKEVTKREFWRASRAWNRYYKNWKFGSDEEKSFKVFCNMIKARHDKTPLEAKFEDHPKYIRKAVEAITQDRLGFNGWGIL